VPGVRGFVTVPGRFGGGGGGAPVQVVLQGTSGRLLQWRDLLMQRMGENPGFTHIHRITKAQAQLSVAVGRNRAADLTSRRVPHA
jgi:hypothetical protein